MKILVLGSGAREHAIILALRSEDAAHEIFAAPGNAGIAQDATLVALDANDPAAVTVFANENAIDLVVIGPEAPLVAGVADALRDARHPRVRPGRAAAQLEGSKAFAKRIMDAAGVPTGRAVRAATRAEVEAALDELGAPHVVKADGLAAGKGVHRHRRPRRGARPRRRPTCRSARCSWRSSSPAPRSRSSSSATATTCCRSAPRRTSSASLDGDAGPNTGGMGAYSPLPWLTERFGGEDEFVDLVTREVAEPVIRQLDAEGTPFIGLLYAGLILTDAGVKVIEFNARFGDPETQVVLPRLVDPLSELLLAAASGHLEDLRAARLRRGRRRDGRAGERGLPAGADHRAPDLGTGCRSRRRRRAPGARGHGRGDGGLVATGGRVLNVVGLGTTFAEARDRAYRALAEITLEGGQHRTDIAARVVER